MLCPLLHVHLAWAAIFNISSLCLIFTFVFYNILEYFIAHIGKFLLKKWHCCSRVISADTLSYPRVSKYVLFSSVFCQDKHFHLACVLRRVYAQLVTSYAHTCDLDFLHNEGQDIEVTILEAIFQFDNILFIPRMAVPLDGLIKSKHLNQR